MTKQEVYRYLDEHEVRYEITEHKAVFNMEEAAEITLPYPDREAKNLFVRDDRKRSYYLITVRGDKRVDLKAFRAAHGTRPLSFASEEDLKRLLDLTPGSVTPLGLLDDSECKVKLFLDSEFLSGSRTIGVHPDDNTATIWLKTEDLISVLKEHGTEIEVFSL